MDLSPVIGLWLGFVLSLMTFSLIGGDNFFSRLAQYLLVGSATGYLMVVVIQDVLRPKLFEPLLSTGALAVDLLVPLVLGLALVVAGLDGTIHQGRRREQNNADSYDTDVPNAGTSFTGIGRLRALVVGIGRIALMVIVGVGIANAVTGTIQGTLIPQFWQATRIQWPNGVMQLLAGDLESASIIGEVIALIMTIGVILHLYVVSYRQSPSPAQIRSDEPHALSNGDSSEAPDTGKTDTYIKRSFESVAGSFVIRIWAAIGKRALWFAAGVLFARLAASRLSLLIARLDYFVSVLETTIVWQQLVKLLETFFG